MIKSTPNLLVFDEDDNEFGDFDFAVPNSFISTISTTTAAVVNGFEEDEWGDFVENRQGSKNGNTIDNTLSLVKDKVWEKQSGAIPLSIFGEEEEHVNDADLESSVNSNAQKLILDLKKVNAKGQMDGLGSHGIKDFIFQLYGQDDHHNSSSGSKDGVGGELPFDDDDDSSGSWEFKNAESGGIDGEADQIQVVENGAVQTFPSQTNDYKKFNGVSQPVTKDINQSDSFFTTKHESKPIICLENGFSPNLGNGDISRTLPIPSDDKFFHSSLPTVKDDLIVSGFNDSVSDLYHDYRSTFNQLDGVNVGCHGNDNNDMVPDLLANNEKDDDFDDDNWEFKDAPSDMFNDNMAQNKDIRNSVADIHENSSLPGLGNTKHQESDHVKTTNEITLSKDVFMSSADFVPPLESSSMFGSGNINVMDLFDDFYGMSDKHGGADKIGNLSDTLNTGADFNHSTNIDSEVSSLEFKGVHSNICNQESNSHQDQVFGNFWDNHMEKLSTSALQLDIEAKNTHDEYFADPPSKIIEAKNLMGFGQFGDIFNDGTQDGHSTSNGFTNFNISNSEDKSCTNYDNLKSTFFNDGIKDQSVGTIDEHELNVFTKLPLEDFMDFYSTVKDASQLLLLRHLDDFKKTHEIAVLCHEDDKAMKLHQEIQKAHAKLDGEVKFSDNNLRKECLLSNDDFVKDLLQTTQKPIFMALEIEYSLSEKILLAEKSLAPAIDLFKHATSILHLLNSTPGEKQRAYIIAWSKILSTCAHELHRGSMIWAQCLQANLSKQILSNPQGFQYFLALGEIYVVTKVLSVSLTIYKPWLLLNPVNSENLWNSMKRCSNFWVNSGLESNLKKMDVAYSSEIKEKIKALLDSIDLIHKLDMPTLQNHVSGHKASLCQLSLLPLGKLQEMKTVIWGGECYFLKLANLWANCISCDPPSLHHLNND